MGASPAFRESNHERSPDIGRFSGGLSSALMALRLASDGVLQHGRGDVVLLANTTVEHFDGRATVSDSGPQGHIEVGRLLAGQR